MKRYTFSNAPSPHRIGLFLAEKGMQIDQQIVDLRTNAHLKTGVLATNPHHTLAETR